MLDADETVQCPYCGQLFNLVLDTLIPEQQLTTDCEVCCRPLDIRVTCEGGEVVDLQVEAS